MQTNWYNKRAGVCQNFSLGQPSYLLFGYDLESMCIGPGADGSFEEKGRILEGGKFVVLRVKENDVGVSD